MTGPNSREGVEEEANVNAHTNSDENKYSKLIKNYIGNKLNSKGERLTFAKKIKSANTTPDEVISEIEAFRASKIEFTGVSVSPETIKLGDLQRELGSFLAGIESQKISLRSIFLQEYDILGGDYTKYISGKIDNISSEVELRTLQDSDTMRDDFLESIFKKKTPKRRLVSHILQDMKLEERFDALEPHLKQGFMDTVSKFGKRESLDLADMMSIFETSILSVEEKQKIIETFMPSISIADAIKLGIFDSKKAQGIKKQALESALDAGVFSGIDLDGYISGIDDSELMISTQGLFNSQKSQDKLFEQNFFFQKFKADFDSMLKKIEEDLTTQSIQTASEMQEILSGINHISGVENFKEGATVIVKQNQKNESGETVEVTLYAELISIASAGTFVLQERGVNEYSKEITKNSRSTYSQFIDYVSKGDIPNSVEFITPETLNHRIRNGDISDTNDNGRFEDKSELNAEIKNINQQIDDRKIELRKNKVSKTQWNYDVKLQELEKIRDQKQKLVGNVEANNTQALIQQIDNLDSDAKKFKLEEGTSFVTKGGKGDVFTITDIDPLNQMLVVRGLENDEPISYKQFLDAFESQKATRVSHINTFDDLFKQGDDAYKTWGEFELKNGKVKNKKIDKIDFDYLVPDSSSQNQELIKIHSIDNTMVTISFGEAKSNNSKDKKGNKKTGEIFSTEKQEYTVAIGVLDHYIRQNGLSFRSLEEGKVAEEEMKGIPKPKDEGKFGTWFFQGMSIASVIKGSETAIEQITNMLNEGDDDKANQFALKMFGPLLGENGKTEMMSRVEQTQKKSMEEFIQRLKDINSYPATVMIDSWLKDPRTPQYKIEAAVFYMFEKYGALCAKQMYPYQGQFYWYQKLGGRIGDSVWVETHEKNDRPPKQNTTEEQLVYNLFSEQVKDGGYGGVKRRSKIAKELKAMRGKGKTEEYDTGVADGSNERSVQDRIDGATSELSSGNYPNAWGWQETIENKGGSMKQMNMVPFITMFSGMAYKFEKDMVDKVKNGAGDSRLLMMKSFISYPEDIDLVNETIMEACKILNKDPKYPDIYSEAKSIFDKQKDKSDEGKKQEATIAFYNKYGEVLTNILYMLNTGKKDDVYNKMIFFEKDNNVTFKRYYDKLGAMSSSADTSFSHNEGLMADSFESKGTSGINMYKATKELLEKGNEGTWRKHDAGPIMWKEIVHEFEAIPKRKYHENPVENERMQKKLLEYNLRSFLAAILGSYTSGRAVESFNSPSGYHTKLNEWGVYFNELSNDGANAESVKGKGNQQIIDRFVQQIIDVENGGASLSKPTRNDGKGGYEYITESKTDSTIGVSDLIQGKAMDTLKKSISPEGLKGFNGDDQVEREERILEDA